MQIGWDAKSTWDAALYGTAIGWDANGTSTWDEALYGSVMGFFGPPGLPPGIPVVQFPPFELEEDTAPSEATIKLAREEFEARTKCECGAAAVQSPKHSSWCPKDNP